jgi:hypothetical protein
MDKEKLLELVDEKIKQLEKLYQERVEILRRTSNHNVVKIDPYGFNQVCYFDKVATKLWNFRKNDETLKEYQRKINSLEEYRKLINNCCAPFNIQCFGLP